MLDVRLGYYKDVNFRPERGIMDTGFSTKVLICADCQEEFVFTIAAQEYFAEKGYTEDPKLCKSCYMSKKREKKSGPRDVEGVFEANPQHFDK